MKKRAIWISLAACVITMMIIGTASAALLTTSDQIYFKSHQNRQGSGGIFDMYQVGGSSTDPVALTFCLEKNTEQIEWNTPFGITSIESNAVWGGGGGLNPDPLSNESAFLYKSFLFGGIVGFDKNNGADQQALQEAFWFLENEIASVSGDAYTWAEFALNNANTGGIDHTLNVKVINPFWTVDSGTTHKKGDRAQSVLYYVPEPGTMGLLGFGMTALAFISRRRSVRK